MSKPEYMPQIGPVTISYNGRVVELPAAPSDILAEEFVDAILEMAGLASKPVEPVTGSDILGPNGMDAFVSREFFGMWR